MSFQFVVSFLLTITALSAFINYKFIKLPESIGITFVTLVLSLVLIILSKFGFHYDKPVAQVFSSIDFPKTVTGYMLSFILFASSMHININQMARFKWVIINLATIGVFISTLIVAVLTKYVLLAFNIDLPFMYCLLFGAVISPTDPIAVLGILKNVQAKRSLEMKISGEALFNDGVGIFLFATIVGIIENSQLNMNVSNNVIDHLNYGSLALVFLREVVGGIVTGVVLGMVASYFMKRVGELNLALLFTLTLVTAGYSIATELLHVSGPLSIVIAGLIVGAMFRRGKMPERIVKRLEGVWELIDELINAILFVLIGFAVLFMYYELDMILISLTIVPCVLLARYISVTFPVLTMHQFRKFDSQSIFILTWGGLRGGVSIALALSIPDFPDKDILLTMTYVVVLFSLLVQGLTLGPVIKKITK